MRWPRHFILDEHGEPREVDDLFEYARWWATADRTVSNDFDEGDGGRTIRVSTVFLGLDHNYSGKGPPVLWESMIFGGVLDGEQERYTSKEAAARGHQELCRRVNETLQHPPGKKDE